MENQKTVVVKGLYYNQEISIDWKSEEQSILEYLMKKYASEAPMVLYTNIAQALPDKSLSDVVFRVKCMGDMEKKGKKKVCLRKSPSRGKLIKKNGKVLDKLEANMSNVTVERNAELLNEARDNLLTILNDVHNTFRSGVPYFPFTSDSIPPPESPPKN